MSDIDAQILVIREKIRQLKKQKAEAKRVEARKHRQPARKPGRKPMKPEIINRARELARTNPITTVAFRLGINAKTLYRYGISRRALNAENAPDANDEAKNKR